VSRYYNVDDVREVLRKYCIFLKESDIPGADFRFTDPVEALCMLSFMDSSVMMLTKDIGLTIRDIGSGDVSPKFENPCQFVRIWWTRPIDDLHGNLARPIPFDHRLISEELHFSEILPTNLLISKLVQLFHEFFNREYYLCLKPTREDLEKCLSNYPDVNLIALKEIGGEDFFEYMGALYLRDRGYVVTKWNPFTGSDFFAYSIPSLREAAKDSWQGYGAFLIEFELYPYMKRKSGKALDIDTRLCDTYNVIVCEAEAGYNLALRSRTGIGQKLGCSEGVRNVYGVGPTTYVPEEDHIRRYFGEETGAIAFTNEHKIYEVRPLKILPGEYNEELKLIENLIKWILLSREYMTEKKSEENLRNLLERLQKLNFKQLWAKQ